MKKKLPLSDKIYFACYVITLLISAHFLIMVEISNANRKSHLELLDELAEIAADSNRLLKDLKTNESFPSSSAEICDGIDNDGDGLIDNPFNLQTDSANCGWCGNACATGQTCSSGHCQWNAPQNVCIASTEVCDNIDNNCDGFIDDETDPLDRGMCDRGYIQKLNSNVNDFPPACLPQAEVNDGLIDNEDIRPLEQAQKAHITKGFRPPVIVHPPIVILPPTVHLANEQNPRVERSKVPWGLCHV